MLSVLDEIESEKDIVDLTKFTILDVVTSEDWFGKWSAAPSWNGWKAFLAALFGLPMTPAQLTLRQGGEVLIERRYSDTLLLALLKAHRPGKFRDDGIAEKLTDEEVKMWTPKMIAAYRAGASLEEVTNAGAGLRAHASEQGSDLARGATLH
jgi:hypothetical protein